MKKLFIFFISLIIFFSCKDDKEEPTVPSQYTINGKVEKGPFISGSKVILQPLNENLELTGSYYTTNITDNEGSYSFNALNLESPYVLLTGEGYYYNEVRGNLSNGSITLTAVVDLRTNTTVNINTLTHLKKERVIELVSSEKVSFKDANDQAQKEILTAFGLQRLAEKDATTISVADETHEAAGLIVISSTILSDNSPAEFTAYLSQLSHEFKYGISSSEQLKLLEESRRLSWKNIAEYLQEYYAEELGKEIIVKDLAYYVDWDGDGIAGNEFDDEGKEKILTFETDTLWIPAEGGKVIANLTTNLNSVLLANPNYQNDNSPGDTSIEEIKLFVVDSIKYTSAVTPDNNIELTVNPSSRALMHPSKLTVYSADGNLSSTITLIQEGNKEKKIEFTEEGIPLITGVLASSRNNLNFMYMIEGIYTNSYSAPNSNWIPCYEHTLTGRESYLENAYNRAYYPLSSWENMKYLSTIAEEIKIILEIHKTILYYEMAILWGNIPYYIPLNNPYETIAAVQTDANTIFNNLIPLLVQAVELSSSFKTQHILEEMFFPSKEVSMGLLARLHLQLKEYDKAKSYLNKIIESNNYSLDINRQIALSKNNKELIYGFSQENYDSEFKNELENNEYIPVLTYTEVILSAAECAYHLGNRNEAEQLLNQIINTKNITDIPDSNFIESLTYIWKQELKGTGSYFAFLKRNDLAISILQIEPYRLLLPLPGYAVDIDFNLKQNPGY